MRRRNPDSGNHTTVSRGITKRVLARSNACREACTAILNQSVEISLIS